MAEEAENLVSEVVLRSLVEMQKQNFGPVLGVEVQWGSVCIKYRITTKLFLKIEPTWRLIVVVEDMCENIDIGAKAAGCRLPDEFHLFLLESSSLVVIVDACKEKCIETDLCKKSGIGIWMSKSVDLPADSWRDSELTEQKLMA